MEQQKRNPTPSMDMRQSFVSGKADWTSEDRKRDDERIFIESRKSDDEDEEANQTFDQDSVLNKTFNVTSTRPKRLSTINL